MSNNNNNSHNNVFQLHTFSSDAEFERGVAEFIMQSSKQAIENHGQFIVAFSGGSLPAIVGRGVNALSPQQRASIEWSKWRILFADERVVPLNDPDSNAYACTNALFQHVGITGEQIVTIDTSQLHDVDGVARKYEADVRRVCGDGDGDGDGNGDGDGVIDLVLLGMGPDGHTCSLFPGHALLREQVRWIAPITDSPKPPPTRITMTIPLIRRAHAVMYVIGGAAKADALNRMLSNDDGDDSIPARHVFTQRGENHVFVDTALRSLKQSL